MQGYMPRTLYYPTVNLNLYDHNPHPSQTDRQTDGRTDEHHGNSATIRSNKRIARTWHNGLCRTSLESGAVADKYWKRSRTLSLVSFVSSRYGFQFATYMYCSVSNRPILRNTENLEIGNWVETDKTVLSCRQFRSHHRREQDKTVLSVSCCPCRRCEISFTFTGLVHEVANDGHTLKRDRTTKPFRMQKHLNFQMSQTSKVI